MAAVVSWAVRSRLFDVTLRLIHVLFCEDLVFNGGAYRTSEKYCAD